MFTPVVSCKEIHGRARNDRGECGISIVPPGRKVFLISDPAINRRAIIISPLGGGGEGGEDNLRVGDGGEGGRRA